MRRAVWVAVGAMTLILCISFFCGHYSREASRLLLSQAAQMEEMLENGREADALFHVKDMLKEWQERENFLSFFLHHQLTDRVTESLEQLQAALETASQYELSSGMAFLKRSARAIYEQEALMLKNIW